METSLEESGHQPPEAGETPDRTRRLEYFNWAVLVLGALVSVYWQNKAITLSFLAGAGLTAFNFRLLRHIVAALCGGRVTTKKKLVAQIVLKFVGGLALLTILMVVFKPKPIPFLLGLSTIVIAIMVEAFSALFQTESS